MVLLIKKNQLQRCCNISNNVRCCNIKNTVYYFLIFTIVVILLSCIGNVKSEDALIGGGDAGDLLSDLIDYTFTQRIITPQELIDTLEIPNLPSKQITDFDITELEECIKSQVNDCIKDYCTTQENEDGINCGNSNISDFQIPFVVERNEELRKCISNSINECATVKVDENNGNYLVLVEIRSIEGDLKDVLTKVNAIEINCYGETTNLICSAYVPIIELVVLAGCNSLTITTPPLDGIIDRICPFRNLEIKSIQLVSPTSRSDRTLSGSIVTEGDYAIQADLLRTEYNVDGTGIMIGIISDSYNCLGGADDDILNGDLPSIENILILDDYDSTRCIDEGRAMMHIIHDIAPGAKLAFHTGFKGLSSFASGILALADAGCDVIVDDVLYRSEPFFQDGIISNAVDKVVRENGIPFFSSIGNYGRSAWDADEGFIDSGIELFPGEGYLHQFGIDDETGNPIISNRLVLPNVNQNILFTLQWDQPFASSGGTGAESDLDIYVYYGSVLCGKGYTSNPSTGDAVESFSVNPNRCSGSTDDGRVEMDVFITLASGPAPGYMKVVPLVADSQFEFPTYSATSFGHDHAELNCAVGAANYLNTPEYGVDPPKIEWFSSAGGAPVFFDANGNRRNQPVIREQPKVIGPDGIATSFFGQPTGDGQYQFFGSSAAAPHVAAVAALLLQLKPDLTPTEVYDVLSKTAFDMDDPLTEDFDVGFDYRTGYGFINALGAAESLFSTNAPATQPSDSQPTQPSQPSTSSPASTPTTAANTEPTAMPSTAEPGNDNDGTTEVGVCSNCKILFLLDGTTVHLDLFGFCVNLCVPVLAQLFPCGSC